MSGQPPPPIVPVSKEVQLCGDYEVTINVPLDVNQYLLPQPEDLFATVANGKVFSKLDLSQAYKQMLLASGSEKYLTINTHLGLYTNILDYLLASSPHRLCFREPWTSYCRCYLLH